MKTIQQLLAGVAALMLAGTAGAQVIRIQPEATVELRQQVRLGDIATVTSTDARTAEILADTVVLTDIRESKTLRAESILMAVVTQQGGSALMNRLQLSGAAACTINIAGAAAVAARPMAMNANTAVAVDNVAIEKHAEKPVVTATVIAPVKENPANTPTTNTLSAIISRRIETDLAAPAEELQVTFETLNPMLDQSPPAGARWTVRPLTRTLMGTVQFEAQLAQGTQVLQRLTVQAKVLRRAMVLVAKSPIAKGDLIGREMFAVEERWLDRKMPTYFSDEKEIIGLESQRALDTGSVLDQRDFKPALLANRSEPVTVLFISGNLKVQMKGRALQPGKMHDQINVKNETTGETYTATLIARRLAVVGSTLDADLEKQLRETR